MGALKMAEPITIQKLIDASLDSDSLEVLVNGDENTDVNTRLGENYPSAKKAIKEMFENGGIPATPYNLYSEMVAAGGAEGNISVVMNDTDASKNGYWLRKSGAWFYAAGNIQNLIASKSYVITVELTKREYVSSTDSYLISHGQLDIYLGSGLGFAKIDAVVDLVVPKNSMYYVDVKSAKAGDTLLGQVTPSDWTSTTYGTGGFVRDMRLPLFTYRSRGTGGYLANRPVLGATFTTSEPVWFKVTDGIKVTYNTGTQTLAWDGQILMPSEWNASGRVILPAHSITFPTGVGYQVAWIDLREVYSNTITDINKVVKISKYNSEDAFQAKSYQVPIFFVGYYNYGALSNFFVSELSSAVAPTGSSIENRFVKSTTTNMSIYQASGNGFIEYNFERETVPFDGATSNGNLDCWRIKSVYDASASYVRGTEIAQGGAWEMAIQEKGAPDYSGTYHGDEVLTDAYFIIDDLVRSQGSSFDVTNAKLEFVQKSKLYRCNTQTEIATVYRHYLWEGNGFTLEQKIEFSVAFAVKSAFLAMIPAKRTVTNSGGAQITDSGLRMYDGIIYKDVDMSTAAFERYTTPVTDGARYKLWGETSRYSFGLELIETPNLPNADFHFANTAPYNKAYFDAKGYNKDDYNTTIGEIWKTKARFSVNKES